MTLTTCPNCGIGLGESIFAGEEREGGDWTAQFDQVQGEMGSLAEVLAVYRRQLLDKGFEREEAHDFVNAMHERLLDTMQARQGTEEEEP